MIEPPTFSDSRESSGEYTSTPRWVKAFGIIALLVVLLFAGVMLFGGGRHGPARHTSSGDAGVSPSSVAAFGAVAGSRLLGDYPLR